MARVVMSSTEKKLWIDYDVDGQNGRSDLAD